ncbi:farnesyl-pyrophosphate synthetase [Talaromyces stipitatus ATCC 10500]|uniref:Farnesyl-pyrophosphate synthetase n=1 Tax=Talaromyces stipitatus (strain ATCC 10500 / CBS 375.48 / QM 6759 / NRRL 1006) TaxID=441959 RepID=B8MAT2_TALSN|nr:farnesyl-pyrophosphate synthetase [Talaromyces stipitatus ATCC 10500]EED17772.1 farnesyl-pyrophosphate synthetase [Talaromyces stipitatus ATCC 10500]
MATRISRSEFEGFVHPLIKDILEATEQYNLPENARKWFSDSLNANIVGGKMNRGMSVPDTGSILLGRPLTDEEKKHLSLLGWFTELLQAFFLVSDDIMDGSITRRGQPCWYRREGVGMIAINDAFMLESAIYVILKKYFRSHPAYTDLLELFHETTWQTELGQLCDLITAPEDHVDLNNFSMEKYTFIVKYKTAYYSFYLPVTLALHYLQVATPKNLKQCEDILIPLGEYFQIQDDYLDAFGSPETIGKIGTDIQDNKCSWLVNRALTIVTPEQRKLLDEAYGRKDSALEAKVKALYNDIKLEQHYLKFEEQRVGQLRQQIEAVDESEGLKKEVFSAFLEKIYKRSK